MKRIRAVFASDTVNRYGSRLAVEALVGALWDNCDLGNPLLLSHDLTRPIGWNQVVAVHMEPGMSRLVGRQLIPEGEDEVKHLSSLLNGFLKNKLVDECKKEVEELKSLISEHLRGSETPLCRGCVAVVEPGLVRRTLPGLFSGADKDGLVPMDRLKPMGPGVYRMGEFAVFAHPSFRRSFSRLNTLNAPFLTRLQRLPSNRLNVRIALDPDMLGLASTYKETVELVLWWGPKFDDDLSSIQTGVTHHEADDTELLFHGISRTEFWWQSRAEEHIFEAEELRDIPDTSGTAARYGCRYVHSLVREDTSKASHIDGAVRTYPEERMVERLESKISEFGRNAEYTKLWRADGEIGVATWKGLLSDYFRDNRLVGEYLGAQSRTGETAPSARYAGAGTPLNEYVPYAIDAGDGVRVSLAFDSRHNGATERTAFSPEILDLNGERLPAADVQAIELKKALERRGGSVRMPAEGFIKYGDHYANLPLVLHNKASTMEELYETLDAVQTLVQAWHQQSLDMVVSHCVVFPVEGKDMLVSVYGHVTDLVNWFSNPLSRPPITIEELRGWASQVSAFLSSRYPKADDTPSLSETLKDMGIFWIDRLHLDEDIEYSIIQSEERNALKYRVRVPRERRHLTRLLEEGKISPALAMLVTESVCSACGAPYLSCGCSKTLDEGVTQRITGARDAFVYWTDRPIL